MELKTIIVILIQITEQSLSGCDASAVLPVCMITPTLPMCVTRRECDGCTTNHF